jgi:putative membrane protein
MLTPDDHARIAMAVDAAEAGTSGEIVVVLASEVSHYPEVALAYAAVAALVIPPLALALGLHPLAMAADAGFWMAAESGALESEFALGLWLYAAVQAVLFVGVFLILEIPTVRRALTPKILKRHRVERAARQQYAAIAARAQGSETGVLIFVAVDDRQVQILADGALHTKADDTAWARAASAIGAAMKAGHDPTSGILEAITICGEPLKAHFPETAPHAHVFSPKPIDL